MGAATNPIRIWLDATWREAIAPEPHLLVSEWADQHRILPATSAEPGPWRSSRTPYLTEIMDALSTGSRYERVILMKGAQLGATECGLNWIGYIIHHAPGLALLVMPSLDMARRNTRTRIDPMIEASPVLRDRIAAPRSRNAYNSAFVKGFDGGQLLITGANSAAALRSTPCRYLFMDEIDGYPSDVDQEGDPVALAIARTQTFKGRRKIFMASTPTVAGVSRIEKAFSEGDQRKFHVACVHCGNFAPIEWKNIRWPEGHREGAQLVCEACGGIHAEHDKPQLLASGQWRATALGDGRTASFHISALYSPFLSWAEVAIEHGAARGDPPRMQAWQNLMLGEAYEDLAAQPIAVSGLAARAESWGDSAPAGVAVVVAGVDCQDQRLEIEIVGFGLGDESWSLDYLVIYGDPAGAELWQELDTVLRQKVFHASGVSLPIRAACIDSGGHHTSAVYNFVRDKSNRSIWATKGASRPGMPPWPRKPIRPGRTRATPVYIIGTEALKDALAARLRIEEPSGPGVCHFPIGRGLDWYEGLTSERPVRKYHKGVARREWVKSGNARNEPLDCRCLAQAALEGLKASGMRLENEIRRVSEPKPARPTVMYSKWMQGL
jgi:phage terminase large subunit GpA-like protein